MAAHVARNLANEKFLQRYERTFNPDTGETIFVSSPVWYKTDFLAGGTTYTSQTTDIFAKGGAGTIAYDSSNPPGFLKFSGNIAHLDFSDNLSLDISKSFNIEFGVSFTWDPTAGGHTFFGFATSYNGNIGSITAHLLVRVAGSSANIYLQGQDGASPSLLTVDGAAGSLVSGTFYVFRIDASDLTNCGLWINGVKRVATNPVNISGVTSTTKKMQPVFSYNPTGGSTAYIDYIAFWGDR